MILSEQNKSRLLQILLDKLEADLGKMPQYGELILGRVRITIESEWVESQPKPTGFYLRLRDATLDITVTVSLPLHTPLVKAMSESYQRRTQKEQQALLDYLDAIRLL